MAVLVKRLNVGFLAATIASVFFLLLLELSTSNASSWRARAVIGLIALYSLSRCNEIFIAFVQDATSHLRPHEAATGLRYYERIGLAMRSYLELVLAYSTIYYAMSRFLSAFPDPLTLLDAIYFSGVTITTIGYGDIRPTHWASKLITVYEVLNGISLIVVSFTVYVSRSVHAREFDADSGTMGAPAAANDPTKQPAPPPEVRLTPAEIVGRYFETQYRRLGQLEEHGLHTSAFIITLTVGAFTFGYSSEAPAVLRNAILPLIVLITNLGGVGYVLRVMWGQDVHDTRAKEALRLHAPDLCSVESKSTHRIRLRPWIQIAIHVVLAVFAAYLLWMPPETTRANIRLETDLGPARGPVAAQP